MNTSKFPTAEDGKTFILSGLRFNHPKEKLENNLGRIQEQHRSEVLTDVFAEAIGCNTKQEVMAKFISLLRPEEQEFFNKVLELKKMGEVSNTRIPGAGNNGDDNQNPGAQLKL